MKPVPVRQFTLFGLGIAACAVIALAVATWQYTQQTLRAVAFVGHTQEVIAALGAAEAQLFRAEASQRSYLVDLRSEFARQRDSAIAEVQRTLDALAALTADNAGQQRRIVALRGLVERRVESYAALQSQLASGVEMPAAALLDEGADLRGEFRPAFAEMVAEERRLLGERQAVEGRRTDSAQATFVSLVAGLVVLLAVMFWRLQADWRARQSAETAAADERGFDAAHARVLTLYNATNDRREALDGTLALLADTGLFPAAVFYEHHELGGQLLNVAARGAPADAKPVLRSDEGLVGAALRDGAMRYLESFDAGAAMRIETGLAALQPAAMLFAPVLHQRKQLGVLVLAAARRLREREREFVERIAAQLGVALHNLGQLEDLSQLAQRLQESAEEIHQKNALLERGSRMKSEFVANMSHELRTPLNAVIGFSEILRDGLAGELNAEQKEYVGDIHDSGKHLLLLINDVLDLSKIEAGQMTLELGPVMPAELVASGMAVVRDKAALRRIRLSETVMPGLGALCADARKLKQLLYNLMSNAVKFTPDGGHVGVSLARVERSRLDAVREADDARVFLPADLTPSQWLEIEVSDTGIGITPAGLRELFQPFVQIDSSLSRKFAGTGLGLTMVKRLAELHGGGLMTRSTPNEGTRFTVWIPWRELAGGGIAPSDAGAGAERASIAPEVNDEAPLVLVIEDDARAASLIQLQLREQGFRIEVVRHAEAGLRRAAELQPQAIVLDIILPGMDGWDLLARLKEGEATRHIPVVIVSITDEPQRGFALGASQVLMKPVAKDELLAALAAAGLAPYNGGGRVLVVDDDPKAVTLVCKHLESAGFTTLCAYGGQQALELLASQRPDLLVLDLMMPHVSGFDVIEALARRGDTAELPIVVLTAKLVTAHDREQLHGRVQRIIEKAEFQPASLLAEVRRAMARARVHHP
ncbi:MAG TPA: response regulator [Methylibium sp.]|uniref:response regulator n=1 Tax=Methylibium sp. TaxID=2067992 RepID=UPI002DBE767E|nr:response regulator [Methylibium sp.]HEU4459452.1 response regulator [Methylibium sp.]